MGLDDGEFPRRSRSQMASSCQANWLIGLVVFTMIFALAATVLLIVIIVGAVQVEAKLESEAVAMSAELHAELAGAMVTLSELLGAGGGDEGDEGDEGLCCACPDEEPAARRRRARLRDAVAVVRKTIAQSPLAVTPAT